MVAGGQAIFCVQGLLRSRSIPVPRFGHSAAAGGPRGDGADFGISRSEFEPNVRDASFLLRGARMTARLDPFGFEEPGL